MCICTTSPPQKNSQVISIGTINVDEGVEQPVYLAVSLPGTPSAAPRVHLLPDTPLARWAAQATHVVHVCMHMVLCTAHACMSERCAPTCAGAVHQDVPAAGRPPHQGGPPQPPLLQHCSGARVRVLVHHTSLSAWGQCLPQSVGFFVSKRTQIALGPPFFDCSFSPFHTRTCKHMCAPTCARTKHTWSTHDLLPCDFQWPWNLLCCLSSSK